MAAPITAQQLTLLMELAAQDENGDAVFSNERALTGYITSNKFMIIPAELRETLNEPPAVDMADLGTVNSVGLHLADDVYKNANHYIRNSQIDAVDQIRIMMANYRRLRNADLTPKAAFFASALRTRWIMLGNLYKTIANRKVSFDEVTWANQNALTGLGIPAKVPEPAVADNQTPLTRWTNEFNRTEGNRIISEEFSSQATEENMRWVIRNAELVWVIVEHMFRVRGHHFKDNSINIIKRMFRAANEGNAELSDDFPFAEVFHTAIHPFGVKALAVMSHHYIWLGKINNAMIVRMSGAPNGSAVITTASAAIKLVSGEAWNRQFRAAYSDVIDRIHFAASHILNHRYNFHIGASLYGVEKHHSITINGRVFTLSELDQEVSTIAPLLQGYISWIRDNARAPGGVQRSFAFADARVLEKRASNNPILIMRMQQLISFTVEHIREAKTIPEAIDNVFLPDRDDA